MSTCKVTLIVFGQFVSVLIATSYCVYTDLEQLPNCGQPLCSVWAHVRELLWPKPVRILGDDCPQFRKLMQDCLNLLYIVKITQSIFGNEAQVVLASSSNW